MIYLMLFGLIIISVIPFHSAILQSGSANDRINRIKRFNGQMFNPTFVDEEINRSAIFDKIARVLSNRSYRYIQNGISTSQPSQPTTTSLPTTFSTTSKNIFNALKNEFKVNHKSNPNNSVDKSVGKMQITSITDTTDKTTQSFNYETTNLYNQRESTGSPNVPEFPVKTFGNQLFFGQKKKVIKESEEQNESNIEHKIKETQGITHGITIWGNNNIIVMLSRLGLNLQMQ